ncbi:MAG: FmdB family zinc ribbon protein [Spirochaetales bacterium]
MPSYDYECKECGHEFEAFQTMSEAPLTECPSCGQESLRRLIGGGMGIIFRGSGFYVNDSRASKSSANGKSGNANGAEAEGKAKEPAASSSNSSEKSSGGEASGSKSA